jgi:hypothetical protein
MAYPEPGMLIVASSAFNAYQDSDRIPEHDFERNDPQNPPITILVGTPLLVVSVPGPVVQLSPWRDREWVWASLSDVQRNTASASAVSDEDVAWLVEHRLLHGAEPETIWAPRTAWEHLDDDLGEP